MRRVLGELIVKWPLTHRGNVLNDANELIKDSLSGDVALIDGITASDGVEGVIWPILAGLPLQVGWDPCRTSCKREVGPAGFDDLLIKVVECTGSEFSPLNRVVEGRVDFVYKVDGLVPGIPARFGIVVGDLCEV